MFDLYKKIFIVLQVKPEEKIIGCFENEEVLKNLKNNGHEYKSVKIPYYKHNKNYNYDDIIDDLWY